MSDAPVQTQAGLETQPPLPVRRLHNFIYCPRRNRSTKLVHAQAASLNDAFECADGNGFVAVHGHDHLPPIGVTPFLVASFLADLREAVASENSDDVLGAANWKPLAHARATSRTFDPLGRGTGDGSNHNSNASLAFRMASSSVSPADAQPGSSGKNAAQRLDSASCSTTSRSFMGRRIDVRWRRGKAGPSAFPPSTHPTFSPPNGSGEGIASQP